jgi:hypothetical protein
MFTGRKRNFCLNDQKIKQKRLIVIFLASDCFDEWPEVSLIVPSALDFPD